MDDVRPVYFALGFIPPVINVFAKLLQYWKLLSRFCPFQLKTLKWGVKSIKTKGAVEKNLWEKKHQLGPQPSHVKKLQDALKERKVAFYNK